MSIHRYCRPRLREKLLAGITPEWLRKHCRCSYITRAVIASPPWISEHDFKLKVSSRDRLTQTTGIKHVLAHIVPLTHHNVCGLNVPWNIKVITWHANAVESNVWYDEPETMLPAHEQLRLFA
jgi:hypothetical protein